MKTADALHALLREKKLTLSTAESCTGGAIAAALTRIPGASDTFAGAVVSYSDQMKSDALHVPEAVIAEHGAVSPEVAVAMWEGILALAKTDAAIAVTGIAGPSGGTPDKPVGTVWAAVGRGGENPEVWNVSASGDRESIIQQTVEEVLLKLLEHLKAY